MRKQSMDTNEIKRFEQLLQTYMERADVEMLNYFRRESTRQYNKSYHQLQADKLNVSLDYYLQEFT